MQWPKKKKRRKVFMSKLKNNSGITLVALVITIIVILILAGVTIATLTGDSGLLTKASEAKKTNEKATTIEKIQVEVTGSYGFDGKINEEQLTNNLKRISGLKYNNATLSDENPIELPAIVEVDNESYQITNDGDVFFIIPQAIGNLIKDNYGDYIDLGQSVEGIGTSSSADDWRILYNDKNNNFGGTNGGRVYAILTDYLPNSNPAVNTAGFTNNKSGTYNVYSTTSRQNLLDRLTNTEAWKSLISTELQKKGATVTGATTAEIIMASYNDKYGLNLLYTSNPNLYIDADSSKGVDGLYVPHPSTNEGCLAYWLASAKAGSTTNVWRVGNNGNVGNWDYYRTIYGVVPIVSLPSNILLTSTILNNKTVWTVIQ